MLIQLRQHGANVQVGISLSFWSLKSRLNGQGSLQKVEGCSHFADPPVIASHVVESHGLTQFVVFTKFLRLLEQVKGTVDILFLQVVDSQNIADLAELFAGFGELPGVGSEIHLFDLEQLLKNSNGFNVF